MNAIVVLYGGALSDPAYHRVFSGRSAVEQTLARARLFDGVSKVVLLATDAPAPQSDFPADERIFPTDSKHWTQRQLFNTLAALSTGFDCVYYAWADCPLLDAQLANAISRRHFRYSADYSYADGFPYGLAPEVLAPDVAARLASLLGETDGAVERDSVFTALQKDINAFNVETELAREDLRIHRLSLCADSKRDLLLLTRWDEAGFSGAEDAGRLIRESPELLRTLPSFYAIQVIGACPQTCALCPYPRFSGAPVTSRQDFLAPERFSLMLDKIEAFSGDAVIDLSLWGELSLHPQKLELIRMVLERPNLTLIVETSGLGWNSAELAALAEISARAGANLQAPLSWIVALDTQDAARYREIRGAGYDEAVETAKTLIKLFPKDAYVQAVRVQGAEDDIERFYRSWKDSGANVIIQKYDSFCGAMPDLVATDLSPLTRRPCWHLMRDVSVLIDGTIPLCREELGALGGVRDSCGGRQALGNIFTDDLETIWKRGDIFYQEQCCTVFAGQCARCDEYYTYNF
jgi:spiro-SPASM protein